jgi:putative heme-binding domain-containing protein
MKTVRALCLVASGVVAAQSPPQNPFAGDPAAAEVGRGMFRIFCSPCHGIKAQGGRGPDLTLGLHNTGPHDADLFRVISEGIPGTEMPGYGERVGGENIWRLVTYVRSIARRETAPPKGNAASGEKLFWGKGACGPCHRVGQRGGRMGPELTHVGRTRSLAHLRESVVQPNADLTPGYYAVTVVQRDGKTITGVQRGFDNFSAQLMDVAENFYSFERSAVASVKREFRSLMPETYAKSLTSSEIDDLVAYMSTLRGTQP